MFIKFRRLIFASYHKKGCIIFSAIWLAGLVFGAFFALQADAAFTQLILIAAGNRVSILLLLITSLVPFLICAFAASPKRLTPIICIGFLKTFMFSYICIIAFKAFGNAAWLIQPMLQFTDLITLPFLYWFSINSLRKEQRIYRDLAICVGALLTAITLDYIFISPFLAMIIER